jgi:hypothetical protein
MTARPYSSYGIDRLELLASSSGDDPDVVARLIAELEHRKTPKARELRSRLQKTSRMTGPQSARPFPDSTNLGQTARSPGVTNQTEKRETAGSDVTSAQYESLRHRYELLRQTFTVEAEVLARWGMTAAMPQDFQELVFGEWMKWLSENPDESGRTAPALQEDRLRIGRERAALRSAATTHRAPTQRRNGN